MRSPANFTQSETVKGHRFGKLVAIAPSKVTGSNGQIWSFLCDCGSFVHRPLTRVRTASKNGIVSSCVPCAQRANAAVTLDRMLQREYRSQWDTYGNLYGTMALLQLERRIRDDLESEFGLVEEPIPFGTSRGFYALDFGEGTEGWIG